MIVFGVLLTQGCLLRTPTMEINEAKLLNTKLAMKKENFCKQISEAVQCLLKTARDSSFNSISDNCKFIISEIIHSDKNFFEEKKIRKTENEKKIPKPFADIIVEIEKLYPNLYDVNLYVYKADKNSTIIEIQYFLRSSLDIEYQKQSATQEPMLHCKVAIPPYAFYNKEKFDINWELGTLNHKWKMLWWKWRTPFPRLVCPILGLGPPTVRNE